MASRYAAARLVCATGVNTGDSHYSQNYMMRETNFLGARAATVMSASDLFSDDDVNVVECAWAAVGVGDAPAKPYPTM